MNQPPNGNGMPANLMPTPANVVSQDQAIAIVEQALGPTMTIVLKGTQASFPGVPAPIIMLAASMVLGKLVGGTFTGMASNAPLKPLMDARTECKRMFEKGIQAVPIMGAGNVGANLPMPPNPPRQG